LLSKLSFAFVAVPVLCFALVGRRTSFGGPPPSFAIKAGALGTLIAAPWWWVNGGLALDYGRYARNFAYHSLGTPSLETWISWLHSVVHSLIGPGVTVVVALVVLAWIWKRLKQQDVCHRPLHGGLFLVCICGALPPVLVQLSGTNHLLRHITPSLVPAAIGVGLLAEISGWGQSRSLLLISCLALFAQLIMIVLPTYCPNSSDEGAGLINGTYAWRAMTRFDQWDWNALREVSNSEGREEPKIAILGCSRNFNPAQIRYVWARAGKFETKVNELWRYERGAIDWDKVMESASQSDIVLTTPDYYGGVGTDTAVDNRHNAEFAARLSHDPRFRRPIRLSLGRFEPVDVDVFIKIQ
jgi:hypothetical protein